MTHSRVGSRYPSLGMRPPPRRELIILFRTARILRAHDSERARCARSKRGLPAQIALDAGGELEVALVIASEAQHEVGGAGIGVALDPGRRARRRPGEAALAGAHAGRGD